MTKYCADCNRALFPYAIAEFAREHLGLCQNCYMGYAAFMNASYRDESINEYEMRMQEIGEGTR